MFNLEQSINDWRRQMQVAGIRSAEHLDELENHLREDVAQQTRAGLGEEPAFAAAVRCIGRAEAIKTEFKKAGESKASRLVKVIGMACCGFAGLFCLFMSPGFLTVAELSPAQRLTGLAAAALTMTCLFSGRFSHKFLPVIHNARIRLAAGVACGVAGLAWILVFANLLPTFILPHLLGGGASAAGIRGSALIGLRKASPDGMEAMFTTAILLMWAIALMAMLGAIAFGLEEAARRRKKTPVA